MKEFSELYEITYIQNYMGKRFATIYKKYYTQEELECSINALYDDPHVIDVKVKKLKGSAKQ